LESFSTPVEQNVHDFDFLSPGFEESYVSDGQLRQVVPLLQSAVNFSQYCETPALLVSSPQQLENNVIHMHMQLPSSWQSLSETINQSSISSTVQFPTIAEECNVMDTLSQLCDTLGDDDMIIDHADLAAFDSSLPAMTPEDVESLLSYDSQSSDTLVPISSCSFDTISCLPPASPTSSDRGSTSSTEWISVGPRGEKVQRKKEQNKTAALRYRQKKRSEHGCVATEYEVLETRNTELKTKVSDMMKEIAYLKDLIAEIYA
jgi:hypothetical protein